MWRNLAGVFGERAVASVHLCDYPSGDGAAVDDTLSEQMNLAREISSLGRAARMNAKLKVRQPLSKVEVILSDDKHLDWLQSHAALVREELNVKEVEFTREADQYITYQIVPNFKRLGPRVGKLMPRIKKALENADGAALMTDIQSRGSATIQLGDETVQLDSDDVDVRLQAKVGWAAAQGKSCVVVLATELTESLIVEGLARDLVRLIQEQRKQVNCQYTDRIEVGIESDGGPIKTAMNEHAEYIKNETLAVRLVEGPIQGVTGVELQVADYDLTVYVKVTGEGS
jgi:isoleucyl-tRNA synthetase